MSAVNLKLFWVTELLPKFIAIGLFIPLTFVGVLAGLANNISILIVYFPYGFILYWYSSTKIMPNILEKSKKGTKTK